MQYNIHEAPKLDESLSPLLNINEEKLDTSFKKLQQVTLNVPGPLKMVWDCLEMGNNCPEQEISVSLEDLADDVEKSIMLVGQASNAITYQ